MGMSLRTTRSRSPRKGRDHEQPNQAAIRHRRGGCYLPGLASWLKWCGLSQTEIADRLGVTVKTIQRTLRGAEITRFIHAPKGQGRRTLLRRNDGKTTGAFRAVVDQRIMKAEYLKHTKNKMVPAKQYGCLMELCMTWGENERLAIFRHFMRPENWAHLHVLLQIRCVLLPGQVPAPQAGQVLRASEHLPADRWPGGSKAVLR